MSDRARVLVVDDELGPRESLRMILKPSYEIATADSGEAALKTLGAFHPDLVFMDIKMPQMDGIELLQRIKQNDPSIEVVMITAYASLETVKNALTHGAFEYLIKPFSRQDLEETARRALARRQTELGTRSQLATLVEEMRSLGTKTHDLEEEARREQAKQSLRVTQLSILREISRGILGQLDLTQLTAAITAQLRDALGYDEVAIHLGPAPAPGADSRGAIVCPISDAGSTVGYLVAANRAGSRPIDPHERELLEMFSEYLAVAIRNSRLYGEVAETKQSLEQLIRSAGDAIISVDGTGRIQGWNPAAERIFGWKREQALGRPLKSLLPEEPYGTAWAALSREQPVASFDATTKREDGRVLTLAVTLSSLTGRDGDLEGMLAIVRDTTAQRELEAQMHQSEKLTALGQMAGGIAHDFNNLLQAILGYAQLMGKNPSNVDVVRRGLDVIEKAATGGAETVRRIQKFARLRPEEAFVALDLDQVIRDSLAITRPRWEEKKIRAGLPLKLELDLGGAPVVMGRPAELNEVVTNLILNAIDAMPDGGTLRVRTRRQGDHHVVLMVTDSGIGMTEDVRKRIFDPFFTTKGEEGTGLGLPVSYSIVKRHGGDIRVESQPGSGTTFTVVLPIGTSRAPEAPATAESIGSRRGRILLVDNEAQVMTILGEMLGEAGHHVVPVGSGAEALRVFVPGGFDLVLTNIGMAGMSGWELAERVRARDPRVPIVFITGWGMQEQDQARCRGLGVSSLLFKPVRPVELHAAVQTALAESGRRERARA
ncbi:MAG TPA: response regulator [Methylomirabilota bacterium]|jgi:PAS domain S-box-containing protein|nr:response regulator [Methylomirabilota bacterium]